MVLYDVLPWNQQLLLDLQMREYSGAVTYDHARPHHVMAFHGTPTWRQTPTDLNYLDFEAGTPDWLDCGAAPTADLDFVAGAFTLAAWINYESVGFRYLMVRGLTDTDGWEWAIDTNSALWLRTNQAGAHQDTTSASGVIPIGAWVFAATTRSGAAVAHYLNGLPSAGAAGAHVNPVTANRELHVGINNAESAGWFDGALWRPRIWTGALSAARIAAIYRNERGMLGV